MKRKGFNTVSQNTDTINAEILDFDALDTSAIKASVITSSERSNNQREIAKKSAKRKAHYPKIECNEFLIEPSLSHKEIIINLVKMIFDEEVVGLKKYFSNLSLPLSKTSRDDILESLLEILQQTIADISQNCPKNVSFVQETKSKIESETEQLSLELNHFKHSLDNLIKYENDIQSFLDQVVTATSNPTQSKFNKNETVDDYLALLSAFEVTCENFLSLISKVDDKAKETTSARSILYKVYKLANSDTGELNSTKEIVKTLQKS